MSLSVSTSLASAIALERQGAAFAIDLDHDVIAVETEQKALETLAAVRAGRGQFEPGLMAGPAGVIGDAGQRPVDARRGDLQIVVALDRVLDIEELGDGTAEAGAIIDIHRAVGAFGHDLKGLGLAGHQAQTHQPVAGGLDHRFQQFFEMCDRRQNGAAPCRPPEPRGRKQ